jgi:hypothetical protein
MSTVIKRQRGGQPGNQNALKQGFYSSVLTGVEKAQLSRVSRIIGLDEEIDLLGDRLKSLAHSDPGNVRLISQLASTIARLMRANQLAVGSVKSEDSERKPVKGSRTISSLKTDRNQSP